MVGGLVAIQGKAAGEMWPFLHVVPPPQASFPSFMLAVLNKAERKLSEVNAVVVTTALPVSSPVPLRECLAQTVLCYFKF